MTEDISGDNIAKVTPNIIDTGGGGGAKDHVDFEYSAKITKPTITITTAATTTTTTPIMTNGKHYNSNNKNNSTGPPAPPSIFLCNSPANCVTLKQVLESMKTPIVEDQAWALIYQFVSLYRNVVVTGVRQVFADNEIPAGIEHLHLHRDGTVHCSWSERMRRSASQRELRANSQDDCRQKQQHHRQFKRDMDRLRGPYSQTEVIASHKKILHSLAVIIYAGLDYNLLEYEQCNISEELEDLITHMTPDEDDLSDSNEMNDDDNIDEGIADENEENDKFCDTKVFDHVLEFCKNHIKPTVPEDHYRAVCRALAAETIELRIFLQHVLDNGTDTLHMKLNSDASKQELAKLGFVDWARFWVQVIDELRQGVRLKKRNYERASIEYELTPYEILMEDIRSKKYQLRKVMVNGDIPPRVKKDAHAVILEFIRSRPPLKKASERKLPPPIKLTPSPRELLLDSIRKGQTLKHIQPPSPRLKDRLLLPPTAASSTSTSSATVATTLDAPAVNQSMSASATNLTTPIGARTEGDAMNANANANVTPRTKQRLIKVDFSLLQDDDHFFDKFGLRTTTPSATNVNAVCSQPQMPPYPIGGYMTICNPSATSAAEPPKQMQPKTTRELRRTTYDLATQCESRRASLRRHTIVGCQSNLNETHSVPPSRPDSRLSDVQSTNIQADGNLIKQQHNQFNQQQKQQQQQQQQQLKQQQQQYLKRSQSPGGDNAHHDDDDDDNDDNRRRSSSSIGPWNKSFLDEKTWNERGDDRLSLTLEEIVHIRSVITKANLEALPVGIGVKEDVEKRKVCFLCLRTRFAIFGPWGIQCKLCQRTVCSKCYTKMRIPSEHLRKVPLVMVSPSLLASPASSNTPSPSHYASQNAVHRSSADNILDETFPKTLIERLLRSEVTRNAIGSSAPSSPKNQRSNMSTPGGIMTTSAQAAAAGQAIEALHDKPSMSAHTSMYVANGGHCINNKHINLMSRSMEGPRSLPANSPARPHSNCSTLDRKSKFSRAFALSSSSGSHLSQEQKENMRGELVAVCFDCKGLVMEISNSSKQTRSSARNRTLKNLTLDLSPVYK